MNTDTKVYLKKRFKEYYWNNTVRAPGEIHRREFGVGTLENKIKFRHKSFSTERELNQYLKTEAPYYISYSAAYYEYPRESMAQKRWLGADLIFDLDKPMKLLSHKLLQEVKEEARNLVGFLTVDFGFRGQDIHVNFSGSKGYHVHVINDEVKRLSGEARREIADYISGAQVDIRYFIREVEGTKGLTYKRGRVKATSGSWVGPRKDSTGWGKRIYDVTEGMLTSSLDDLLALDGIGRKTAEKIVADREKNMRLLEGGRWDALMRQFGRNIQKMIYGKAVKVVDEDRQVTFDTARLIRLPDTIHGGSGLLAKRVAELDKFDPLVDAVAFKGSGCIVLLSSDVGVFQLLGRDFGPYKSGERVELDDAAAVYLMLKGLAEVPAVKTGR